MVFSKDYLVNSDAYKMLKQFGFRTLMWKISLINKYFRDIFKIGKYVEEWSVSRRAQVGGRLFSNNKVTHMVRLLSWYEFRSPGRSCPPQINSWVDKDNFRILPDCSFIFTNYIHPISGVIHNVKLNFGGTF